MWNRTLDKLQAVLQRMVRKEGDKTFFWLGWLMVVGPFSVTYTELHPMTWKSPFVEEIIPLGGLLLWFVVGKVIWASRNRHPTQKAGTIVVALLGSFGLGTVIGMLDMAAIMVFAVPSLLTPHWDVDAIFGVVFLPVMFLLLAAFPLGVTWAGYRIGSSGWLWGLVAGILFVVRPYFSHREHFDNPASWIMVAMMVLLSGVFGCLGQLIAKREHREPPAEPIPPTIDLHPAPQ